MEVSLKHIFFHKNVYVSRCEYKINGKWIIEEIYVNIDNGKFVISRGEAEIPGKYPLIFVCDICMYVCMYIYVHIYVFMYLCIYLSLYVCM